MGTKRANRTRSLKAEITDVELDILVHGHDRDHGADGWVSYYMDAEKLWAQYGEMLTAEWIKVHPGSRPDGWWRFSAPRLAPAGVWPEVWAVTVPDFRQRLGGAGQQWHDLHPGVYCPVLERAIPQDFIEDSLDPTDPPRYESEAAYLRRHGLLEADEAARLTEADYAPEVLLVELDDPKGR